VQNLFPRDIREINIIEIDFAFDPHISGGRTVFVRVLPGPLAQ
jgi:hypothetical protein